MRYAEKTEDAILAKSNFSFMQAPYDKAQKYYFLLVTEEAWTKMGYYECDMMFLTIKAEGFYNFFVLKFRDISKSLNFLAPSF